MKYLRLILISTLFITQSCVQETHTKTVTFKVDMNAIENVSNVGVKGNFTDNPWNETASLIDDNRDGIYEGTFSQKTAVNSIEFKFVHNDNYELKGQDNRSIQFEYKPETIVYEGGFNNPNGEQKVISN